MHACCLRAGGNGDRGTSGGAEGEATDGGGGGDQEEGYRRRDGGVRAPVDVRAPAVHFYGFKALTRQNIFHQIILTCAYFLSYSNTHA